jgi:hypothetical protein
MIALLRCGVIYCIQLVARLERCSHLWQRKLVHHGRIIARHRRHVLKRYVVSSRPLSLLSGEHKIGFKRAFQSHKRVLTDNTFGLHTIEGPRLLSILTELFLDQGVQSTNISLNIVTHMLTYDSVSLREFMIVLVR